jgi:hypothetical protein
MIPQPGAAPPLRKSPARLGRSVARGRGPVVDDSRFAADSPLEEAGFELVVPLCSDSVQRVWPARAAPLGGNQKLESASFGG